MSRDIQAAYKNQTRATDGRPGKNYWQNNARYDINITAMPPDRNIKGSETITYFNNSPDTLETMAIKLFLNIHKPGAPRERTASPDYLTSGVFIDACKVDGQAMSVRNDVFTLEKHLRSLTNHPKQKYLYLKLTDSIINK